MIIWASYQRGHTLVAAITHRTEETIITLLSIREVVLTLALDAVLLGSTHARALCFTVLSKNTLAAAWDRAIDGSNALAIEADVLDGTPVTVVALLSVQDIDVVTGSTLTEVARARVRVIADNTDALRVCVLTAARDRCPHAARDTGKI
jgi:hypothetical protein